jgi:uncharacterized protein YbdZ (MbtH family)
MKHYKAFILMDLLLGIALLLIIAGSFTRISIMYRQRCRQLAAIRRHARMEAYMAYTLMRQHPHAAAMPSGWRLAAVPTSPAKQAALPAGFHWMAVRPAHDGKLPMLYFLREEKHATSAEPEQ